MYFWKYYKHKCVFTAKSQHVTSKVILVPNKPICVYNVVFVSLCFAFMANQYEAYGLLLMGLATTPSCLLGLNGALHQKRPNSNFIGSIRRV